MKVTRAQKDKIRAIVASKHADRNPERITIDCDGMVHAVLDFSYKARCSHVVGFASDFLRGAV